MSTSNISTGDRKAFYEQLTADNAAVLLVDHQVGLFTGVVDIDVLTLKHNVVALAKAARVLGVPTMVTATAPDSMWGPTIPELLAARPDLQVLARTTVNPWDEPRFTQAVEALGRKKLIIAGVSTEVCLGLTAIRAVSRGRRLVSSSRTMPPRWLRSSRTTPALWPTTCTPRLICLSRPWWGRSLPPTRSRPQQRTERRVCGDG